MFVLYKKEVLENNIKIITKERDCNYHEIEALDIITEGMSEQEKITYKLNLINKIELQCKKRRQYKNDNSSKFLNSHDYSQQTRPCNTT